MKIIYITLVICLVFSAPLTAEEPVLLLTNQLEPFCSPKLPGFGFMPEIVSLVFKEMEMDRHYKFYPWKRCEFLVEAGEAWATFPYSYTDERAEKFYFSDIIGYSTTLLFYFQNNQDVKFNTIKDLKKYRIGGVDGYFYQEMFQNEDIQLSYSRNEITAFKKLIAGRIDLLPMNELFAWGFLEKRFPPHVVSRIGRLKKPLSKDPLHLMVSKTYSHSATLLNRFNDALKKIKMRPEYRQIFLKYGVPPDEIPVD